MHDRWHKVNYFLASRISNCSMYTTVSDENLKISSSAYCATHLHADRFYPQKNSRGKKADGLSLERGKITRYVNVYVGCSSMNPKVWTKCQEIVIRAKTKNKSNTVNYFITK